MVYQASLFTSIIRYPIFNSYRTVSIRDQLCKSFVGIHKFGAIIFAGIRFFTACSAKNKKVLSLFCNIGFVFFIKGQAVFVPCRKENVLFIFRHLQQFSLKLLITLI